MYIIHKHKFSLTTLIEIQTCFEQITFTSPVYSNFDHSVRSGLTEEGYVKSLVQNMPVSDSKVEEENLCLNRHASMMNIHLCHCHYTSSPFN